MGKRKTANEKLIGSGKREVVDIPDAWIARMGSGKLLIPLPTDVLEEIRGIPTGSVREFAEIRKSIARRFDADEACPLVSGISWRLVAEAAEEDRKAGRNDLAPYWRVIKANGELNEKLPGGSERHASYLESEGHTIVRNPRSNKPRLAV